MQFDEATMSPERNGLDGSPVHLTVQEISSGDSDRGIVRLDLSVLSQLGLSVGDVICLEGRKCAYARAMPLPKYMRGKGLVQLDATTRHNAGVAVDSQVNVYSAEINHAKVIALASDGAIFNSSAGFEKQLPEALENIAVVCGNRLKVRLSDGREIAFAVKSTIPKGPLLIAPDTQIKIEGSVQKHTRKKSGSALSYNNLGGLSRELARVREMIELPMKRADLFEHIGIQPPRGVLLSGPPGTGKTLLARAVASECDASFFQINGPEIVGKHYGESEKHLRDIFKQAEKDQPAVLFIDEIDAIAPNRESLAGDRQVERRIVGQLLTLMDGLTNRGQVVVMAATNLPNALDPALRRPGRFDREIKFNVPDKASRREILEIHTADMPLGSDVDMEHLASITHGYVGADLAAFAREAGMAALRNAISFDANIENLDTSTVSVGNSDFMQAFKEIVPSALREVFTDIPETGWDDVGGHETIKQTLIESVVWPLKFPQMFDETGVRPNKGVLLSGLPGTGKTLLARTLASEAGVSFISVRGPQLLSQYMGESEKAIRDVFQKARLSSPCIVFFDEIDSLLPVRGGNGGAVLDRVVAQFLTEMDGIEDLKGVFILAATNRADQVDPAVIRPGRFDLVLDVGLPDDATKLRILEIHSRQQTRADDIDFAEIVSMLDFVSGADIETVCRQAALTAIRRCIAESETAGTQTPVVTMDDYVTAVNLVCEAPTDEKGKKT